MLFIIFMMFLEKKQLVLDRILPQLINLFLPYSGEYLRNETFITQPIWEINPIIA